MFRLDRDGATHGATLCTTRADIRARLTSIAAPEDSNSLEDLQPDEVLAAYLSREPHVAPLMRLLLDMGERQRSTLLMMAQCLALEAR